MPAAELASLVQLGFPYPGLRPFEANEAFLFFGRQPHIDDLLKRLSAGRFLAVVGTSGSGKSSLVRAGLLPALYRGFLVGATSRWRIAVMRPGNAPMDNLCRAMHGAGVGGANVQQIVCRSSLGLTEAVRQTPLAPGESVLLVVDQFEELFRFQRERRQQDGGSEASLFVSSLLEASESFGASIYVVITMRSDFLGDCTQFPGLAEELNQSQYLIPRLSREQRREAVERPLQMVGANMAPRLVQRLLNELGDEPDQLPVLQHALNRTFGCWKAAGGTGDVDFAHYEAAGGLADALNDHADTLLAKLTPNQQQWAERLFRALTTFDGNRAIRRPGRFARLCVVTGARTETDSADLRAAIGSYAHPDNSLLVAAADIQPDTIIDISHESLIRNWKRLRGWLVEEAAAVGWYRSVADDVARHARNEASTWRDPELQKALGYVRTAHWNAAWADRNQLAGTVPFEEVTAFLNKSSDEQAAETRTEDERRRKEIEDAQKLADSERRSKRLVTAASLLVLLIIVAAGVIYYQKEKERDLNDQREAAEKISTAEKARADGAVASLDAQLKRIADLQKVLTSVQAESGQKARDSARLAAQVANLQKIQSEIAAQRAQAVQAAKSADDVYNQTKVRQGPTAK